jgi:hypothetical protein
MTIAPGKRSATRGCGRKMISSLFPFPVWRASGAPDRKGKKGGWVWCVLYPGQRPRLRFAAAGLALGYFLAAPSGAAETPGVSTTPEQFGRAGQQVASANAGRAPRFQLGASGPAWLRSTFANYMKHWPASLRIFVVHTALVAASLLLMFSPLGKKPGAIHPLLIVPFFYFMISGLPYVASIIRGLYELRRGVREWGSVVAVGASFVILSALGCWIVHMWPAWMGI